ncbi:MAG: patatin-like phospholipase family protein [Bryobacteraceae bacterium]|nr:patatin-like phospholipase family protein [Bryobacteraceae bacterium]
MKLAEWWGWARRRIRRAEPREPAIGLALGGGFARGIAHIGVLRVFEQHRIPIRYIAGVSAGSIVAAAFASGRSAEEIAGVAGHMRFRDVARWTLSRMGLMDSDRMEGFLKKLLKAYTFEQMRIPLAVVATDLNAAKPVVFRDRGEVFLPIRASCAYPGLFRPIRYDGRYLVDGAITMEIPALPLREMGATHVVSVVLPMPTPLVDPQNLFRVVNQCFQILQARTDWEWRKHSDVVVAPEVSGSGWDSFGDSERLIAAGEQAARAALPMILAWIEGRVTPRARQPGRARA